MRSKWLYPLLAALGAACVGAAGWLHANGMAAGEGLVTLFAFPLSPIGQGLRALSLQGGAGNLLAWAVYLLLCLLPAGAALWRKRKGHRNREDWLLVLLSGLLFPILYGMVNPELLRGWFSEMLPAEMAKATCGAAVWVCAIGWAVLRLVAVLPRHTTGELLRGLGGLLILLEVLAVVQVCLFECYDLLAAWKALAEGNTGLSDRALLPSRLFLLLKFAAEAVPTLLLIGVLHHARQLLAAAGIDRYSSQTVSAAERMARVCRRTVTASVLAGLGFSVAQLACAPLLRDLDSTVHLPLSEIALGMAALLWARWMAEGRALKEENEGFI